MSVHNKVDNYCTVESREKSHGLLNDVDNQIAGCESPQSIHQRSSSCRVLLGVLSLHITSKNIARRSSSNLPPDIPTSYLNPPKKMCLILSYSVLLHSMC